MVLVEDVPVLHLEQHFADLRLALRIAVFHVTADHALDDPVFRDFLGVTVERFDRATIAQDGDLIGNLADFVELVGDDERGHPLLAELHQKRQQCIGIRFVQRSRRLVEDQQLDLLRQRLGDFDELLLADADIRDARRRRVLQAHLRQQLFRPRKGLGPMDHALVGDLVAEEDVFGNRQERHESQFLVNDDDAEFLAVRNPAEPTDLAVVKDVAVIGSGGIDATQNLHQRGFAGAVFADQRVDLALAHLEADIVQRLDAGECLCDATHLENDVVHVQNSGTLPAIP